MRAPVSRRVHRPMVGGWGYQDPGYGLTRWLTSRGEGAFFAHAGSVSGNTAFVMGNRTHPHPVRISNLAMNLLAEALGESR